MKKTEEKACLFLPKHSKATVPAWKIDDEDHVSVYLPAARQVIEMETAKKSVVKIPRSKVILCQRR